MSEKIFRDTRIQIGILKSRGVIIKNKKWAVNDIYSSDNAWEEDYQKLLAVHYP